MIEPHYTISDNLLTVKSEGIRDNFLEVALDHVELVKQIDQHKPKKILLDHTEVKYQVNQSDAFNLIKLYQKNEPKFNDLKVACCVNSKDIRLSKYWEELAIARGFSFKVFTSLEDALNWLNN